MDAVRQAMIKYREDRGLSQAEMGKLLGGMTQQTYGNIENGRNKKTIKDVEFIKLYKDVTGIDLSKLQQSVVGTPLNAVREPHGTEYLNHRFQKKLNAAPQFMVPLVPVKARAGYVNSHQLFEFIESLEKYPIAPGIDHRGYEWRWFEVAGESMEPNFYEGDFILCSMVPPDQWQYAEDYLVHVIVTKDDIIIKRIIKEKGGNTWILHSDNKRFKQQRINVEGIEEVWKFRRNLNARVPPVERIKIEI